ncbi:2OG-Fe(II) oxygenase [Flavobacterium sp. NRK F10]|uniref:2OG-Fe(II) oxygenase n=1 Tax=Flavobacterium sp. NRK F10 TaxID=2954931 RepID=UPI0020919203|nr:2OG-Fe(II) oxygenase [Flavobacterium sp. NRK F10]MCO6174529.1 2OG-Fe(II) oxygenase [Flavobacterium sp. NRK F10]
MNGLTENPMYEKIIEDLLNQQYSIVDDFFTEEAVTSLRNSLLDKYEEDYFKKSAIGDQFNEQVIRSIRGDFISWIEENKLSEVEQNFFSRIDHFSNYLNQTCFLGIQDREFHYALYPVGTFYKRHLDIFQNDDSRKLSVVCYLNDENWLPEYGGELVIYKEHDEVKVYPLKGRVVIFESQVLEHEVLPVMRERLSITGWLKTRRL